MENESKRPVWLLVLIAVAAIALWLYSSIEIVDPNGPDRPVGGIAELESLSERTDTNILFVLIDTLRAERMSAYGYERDTTPFLKELADSGIRFNRHIAQSSWTKSSMASLWSGMNPIRSGVTKFDHTLSSKIVMPAEILADAGFKNVGMFRNGWVNGYFGFNQGFEKYYRPGGGVINPNLQRMKPNLLAHVGDEDLIADAIEFLRIHGKSSRWMLYLHLMDLHEYTYDEESAKFGTQVADLYDNSMLRTDWVFSKLYGHLNKMGLLENTIVVVLSDHGEAFGERGIEGHARSVFPETTETPLIISLPFQIEGGLVVEDRTMNVDVWPTLLDMVGLPAQGRDLDGRSRMPELMAKARGEDFEEADGDRAVAFLDENWGRPESKEIPTISIVEGPYRYVKGTNDSGNVAEVLLSIEDGQVENRIEEFPEIAARLREEADRQLAMEPEYEADIIELDEMQLDQLRALGYELP